MTIELVESSPARSTGSHIRPYEISLWVYSFMGSSMKTSSCLSDWIFHPKSGERPEFLLDGSTGQVKILSWLSYYLKINILAHWRTKIGGQDNLKCVLKLAKTQLILMQGSRWTWASGLLLVTSWGEEEIFSPFWMSYFGFGGFLLCMSVLFCWVFLPFLWETEY